MKSPKFPGAIDSEPGKVLVGKPAEIGNKAQGFRREVAEVKRLHATVSMHARDARDKALQIGEVLTGIKASLSHGEWLPWLESNLPEITPRTVQNYMRMWTNRDLIKNEDASYLVENLTAGLATISKQQKSDPEDGNEAAGENVTSGGGERARKRELLRILGREFIAGLETEDTAVLELVASRLPDWRHGLLEAARRGINEATADVPPPEPNPLAS